MSTSSTARAIVRDLAALHVKDNRKEARTPDESSRMAFDQFLPPFPEVSAYIGEQNTSALLGIIAEEEPDVADSGPVDTIGEIVHRLPQTNKVAAKKHRELIKERTKNVVILSVGRRLIHNLFCDTVGRRQCLDGSSPD